MRLLRFLLLFASVWTRGATDLWAQAPDFRMLAVSSRFAHQPRLTVDRERDLCAAFLREFQIQFKQYHPVIDAAGAPMFESRWHFVDGNNIVTTTQPTFSRPISRDIRRVDLRGDGTMQFLVHIVQPFNWRGDWHTLALFDSEDEIDPAIEPAGSRGAKLAPFVVVPAGWVPHAVLQFRDQFYVLKRHDSPWVHTSSHALHRIHADRHLEETCKVEIFPEDWAAREKRLAPGLGQLYDALAPILGLDGPCGGTSSPIRHHQLLAFDTRMLALFRPWVLLRAAGDGNPFQTWTGARNSRAEIDIHLENWAREALSNFRARRALAPAEIAAQEDLTAYYRRVFALNEVDANVLAVVVSDQVLRRHFSIYVWSPAQRFAPAPFDAADVLRATSMVEAEATDQLLLAALHGADGAVIDHLIALGANVRDANSAPFAPTRREAPILFALEHPRIVAQLLDAGADPNQGNDFGKTSLMYAAQYDLIETARLLLARGADVNRATQTPRNAPCTAHVNVERRTALMYAAENASLDMITLLLAHGADRKAIDTGRRGLESYLARNTRLTPAEKEVAGRLLDSGPVNP